jgi:hypothetical protein
MVSELSSILGLRPKHAAVLITLKIGTAQQLASADRRVIHAAMRRLRPAPTLEAISGWQDQARDLAGAHADEPVTSSRIGRTGWEQAAAFVVSFETRKTRTDQDHRLVVEQVEQAPPEPRQEWPAWAPEAAWTWMHEKAQLRVEADVQPASESEQLGRAPARAGRPRKGSAGERRGATAPAAGRALAAESGSARARTSAPGNVLTPQQGSGQEKALLTAKADESGRIRPRIAARTPELALANGTARRIDADGPSVDVPPGSAIRVKPVSEPGMTLHVALRLRRAGAPSYAPSAPVTVLSAETAEIGLQDLPAGEHDAVLAIWAAGGAAAAAVVQLPQLRVRP